jgi:hypothetical protein
MDRINALVEIMEELQVVTMGLRTPSCQLANSSWRCDFIFRVNNSNEFFLDFHK